MRQVKEIDSEKSNILHIVANNMVTSIRIGLVQKVAIKYVKILRTLATTKRDSAFIRIFYSSTGQKYYTHQVRPTWVQILDLQIRQHISRH